MSQSKPKIPKEKRPRRREGRWPSKRPIVPREKRVKSVQKPSEPDSRIAVQNITTSNQPVLDTANPSIVIETNVDQVALTSAALAVVSYALQRGFLAESQDPNYPFWAYVYLIEILCKYAQNITPASTTVPCWLSIIGQSIMPKSVKYRAGHVSYSFANTLVPLNTMYTAILGPPNESATWNVGQPGNIYINGTGPPGFGLQQVIAPGGYTNTNGERAWSLLATFLQNSASKEGHLDWASSPQFQRLVESNSTNFMTKDASAYADNAVSIGGSYSSCGGFGIRQALEVPVRSPMFGVFATKTIAIGPEPNRYTPFVSAWTGDAALCAGLVCTHLTTHKQCHMKTPPVFKPVDFNALMDVLAYWVTGLVSNASNNAVNTNPVSQDPGAFQCPLSLQEASLLFRNVVMQAFKDSQYMVQTNYPDDSSTAQVNTFVPFVCGFGTYPSSETSMLLPLPLVENIRALTMSWNVAGKGKKSNPSMYIPILGKYHNIDLDMSDYVARVVLPNDGGTLSVDAFKTPTFKTRRQSITKDSKKPSAPSIAEVPVSVVDGKAASGLYMISDPAYLTPLAQVWNSWIATVQNFTPQLTTISTDAGISILKTVVVSDVWIVQNVNLDLLDIELLDMRFLINKKLVERYNRAAAGGNVQPYIQIKTQATTFADKPLAAVWESALQFFVRPTFRLTISTADEPGFMSLQKMQAYAREPFSLTMGDSIGQDQATNHANFATMMIIELDGAPNAIYSFMADMAKLGRGGILSSMVAGFLADTPLGGIAKTVAGFLPI